MYQFYGPLHSHQHDQILSTDSRQKTEIQLRFEDLVISMKLPDISVVHGNQSRVDLTQPTDEIQKFRWNS